MDVHYLNVRFISLFIPKSCSALQIIWQNYFGLIFTLYLLGFSDYKPSKSKLRLSLLVFYHFIIKSANVEVLLLLLALALPTIVQKLYCIHINLYLCTDRSTETKSTGQIQKLPLESLLPHRNSSQAGFCPQA